MVPSLVVEDLWKSYGWRNKDTVLKGVSFTLEPGRCCGLLGPNGAGKTTLIKIILGLLRPDRGSVSLFGQKGFSQELKYRVGFLPEESYLYSFLSIQETMDFALKIYGNTAVLRQRSIDLLKAVRLDQVTQRKISECSKGMRRRVAFAQTLLHDPELIILDEPTSGFDPMGMVMMKNIIRDLHAQGKTILICSHQLKEVQDLCQDIVILNRGETIAKGELLSVVSDRRYMVSCPSSEDQARLMKVAHAEGVQVSPSSEVDLEKFFVDLVSLRSE